MPAICAGRVTPAYNVLGLAVGQRAFQGDGVLRGQGYKVVFTACDGEYLTIGQGAADAIIAAAQHGEAGNAIVIGRYGQENLILRVQYFRRCAGKGQIACIQRAVGVEIMIESNFKRCYVHHADGPHGRGFAVDTPMLMDWEKA